MQVVRSEEDSTLVIIVLRVVVHGYAHARMECN